MRSLMRKSPPIEDVRRTLAPLSVADWRIALVYSSFYREEMETMVDAAVSTLIDLGILAANIGKHPVSGSFEIPLIGAALAERGVVDALIGLGIVVQGETHHAELVAEQAARGIMDVQTMYRIPFVCEVLFVDTLADAKKRLSKGEDAALCALRSLADLARLQS